MNIAIFIHYLVNVKLSLLLILIILNENISLILSQLVGSEKTMEQFLDRLLHESVYDRRIRPFYTDSKSMSSSQFKKLIMFFNFLILKVVNLLSSQ